MRSRICHHLRWLPCPKMTAAALSCVMLFAAVASAARIARSTRSGVMATACPRRGAAAGAGDVADADVADVVDGVDGVDDADESTAPAFAPAFCAALSAATSAAFCFARFMMPPSCACAAAGKRRAQSTRLARRNEGEDIIDGMFRLIRRGGRERPIASRRRKFEPRAAASPAREDDNAKDVARGRPEPHVARATSSTTARARRADRARSRFPAASPTSCSPRRLLHRDAAR